MKKFNRTLILALCLLTTTMLWAQDHTPSNFSYTMKRANKLFDNYAYQNALDLYKDLLEHKYNTPKVKLQMAECYRYLNNPRKAILWYGDVMGNDEIIRPEHKFYYAESLFKIGHYEKAKNWLSKYQEEVPDDDRTRKMIQAIDNYPIFFKDSARYLVRSIRINSPESDFSPSYYQDGIVFASARKDPAASLKQKYNRDNSFFLELYYARQKPDSTMAPATKFNPEVNTKFHESTTVFYDNQTKMLFTRNNFYEKKLLKSSTGDINLKLFSAERPQGSDKWENIAPLSFNSDEYSVGHPAIAKDGKRMFFVSDMPGGFGGTDIYTSEWTNGAWSSPENMGPKVNTKGKEMFPFVYDDETLFFASDGHYGMGALDNYHLDLTTKEVTNLGAPLNSQWDDFGFIKNEEQNSGWLSSNRPGGKGNDDIYQFYPLYLKMLALVVDEKTDQPVAGAEVYLLQNEKVIDSVASAKDGNASFKLDPKEEYTLLVRKSDYASGEHSVSTSDHTYGQQLNVDIPLRPLVLLTGKAYDLQTKEAFPFAEIALVNESTGEEVNVTADENGNFKAKVDKEAKYTVVGKHDDQTGIVSGFTLSNGSDSVVQELAIGLGHKSLELSDEELENLDDKAKTALIGDGVKITGAIKVENIYYDLNKSFIRPDAGYELDKLVMIMKENRGLKIEISSHTDSRGRASYNQNLSQRRAESAVIYMAEKGIDRSRLVAKGYGEARVANKCADGVPCTEEEHQFNRRTEFEVLN